MFSGAAEASPGQASWPGVNVAAFTGPSSLGMVRYCHVTLTKAYLLVTSSTLLRGKSQMMEVPRHSLLKSCEQFALSDTPSLGR